MCRFLQKYRGIIANYIRGIYQLDPLAYKEAHQMIIFDERLFIHLKGEPIWVVG